MRTGRKKLRSLGGVERTFESGEGAAKEGRRRVARKPEKWWRSGGRAAKESRRSG